LFADLFHADFFLLICFLYMQGMFSKISSGRIQQGKFNKTRQQSGELRWRENLALVNQMPRLGRVNLPVASTGEQEFSE